jgi:hypothetical protein
MAKFNFFGCLTGEMSFSNGMDATYKYNHRASYLL